MTYEEACKLLGWEKPPAFGEQTQKLVINGATQLSGNGKRPIDPWVARLYRMQAESFG
jgi:hypothetical protein